jgi:Predicted integral membrane protein
MILLFLHILGAVILAGNIITSIFWKYRGDSTKDLQIITHTHREIRRADRIFSHIGIALVLITGLGLWHLNRIQITQAYWLLWGLILFIVSVIVWAAVIVPNEKKLIALSEKALVEGKVDAELIRASKRWYNGATLFVILLVIILFLMIYRPV